MRKLKPFLAEWGLVAALLAVAMLLWTVVAFAASPTLLKATITTAVSNVTTTPVQLMDGAPYNLEIQSNFIYGSGGTSADAWVQRSGWTFAMAGRQQATAITTLATL